MYICLCVSVSVRVYLCESVFISVCISICVYLHLCMYVCICVCVHAGTPEQEKRLTFQPGYTGLCLPLQLWGWDQARGLWPRQLLQVLPVGGARRGLVSGRETRSVPEQLGSAILPSFSPATGPCPQQQLHPVCSFPALAEPTPSPLLRPREVTAAGCSPHLRPLGPNPAPRPCF